MFQPANTRLRVQRRWSPGSKKKEELEHDGENDSDIDDEEEYEN